MGCGQSRTELSSRADTLSEVSSKTDTPEVLDRKLYQLKEVREPSETSLIIPLEAHIHHIKDQDIEANNANKKGESLNNFILKEVTKSPELKYNEQDVLSMDSVPILRSLFQSAKSEVGSYTVCTIEVPHLSNNSDEISEERKISTPSTYRKSSPDEINGETKDKSIISIVAKSEPKSRNRKRDPQPSNKYPANGILLKKALSKPSNRIPSPRKKESSDKTTKNKSKTIEKKSQSDSNNNEENTSTKISNLQKYENPKVSVKVIRFKNNK